MARGGHATSQIECTQRLSGGGERERERESKVHSMEIATEEQKPTSQAID